MTLRITSFICFAPPPKYSAASLFDLELLMLSSLLEERTGRMEEEGIWREGSEVLTKIFRSRTELRLETKKQNFEFDAGGEREPLELLVIKEEMREKKMV